MADSPELPDRVRSLIRLKHYSIRAEEAYVHWIKDMSFNLRWEQSGKSSDRGKPEYSSYYFAISLKDFTLITG